MTIGRRTLKWRVVRHRKRGAESLKCMRENHLLKIIALDDVVVLYILREYYGSILTAMV